jgi:hypothetical protein
MGRFTSQSLQIQWDVFPIALMLKHAFKNIEHVFFQSGDTTILEENIWETEKHKRKKNSLVTLPSRELLTSQSISFQSLL